MQCQCNILAAHLVGWLHSARRNQLGDENLLMMAFLQWSSPNELQGWFHFCGNHCTDEPAYLNVYEIAATAVATSTPVPAPVAVPVTSVPSLCTRNAHAHCLGVGHSPKAMHPLSENRQGSPAALSRCRRAVVMIQSFPCSAASVERVNSTLGHSMPLECSPKCTRKPREIGVNA